MSIPLILALSVIPDVDILFTPFLEHRGPMHSIVMATVFFVPIFAIYHKKAIPYFVSLVQHSIVGDYLSGGQTQLFWPITKDYFGVNLKAYSLESMALEWSVFVISVIVMLRMGDLAQLLKPKTLNLILIVPTFTLLAPSVLSLPLALPVWLLPPHLIYAMLLSASVVVLFRKRPRSP